jgi:hypothetical protein
MRLLLDEHVHPAVAAGLRATGVAEVVALRDWQQGVYMHVDDDILLRAAYSAGWTLVTYDLRTIPLLLRTWGEQGIAHAGVIVVDDRSIDQTDIGGLIRALLAVVQRAGDDEWENRTECVRRV